MRRLGVLGCMGFLTIMVLFSVTVRGEDVTLENAIEKACDKTGRKIISASLIANFFYMVQTADEQKTEGVKVYVKTGEAKCMEAKDTSPVDKLFCSSVKIPCLDAIKSATKECSGKALSVKGTTLGGVPHYTVVVKTEAQGDLAVQVSGVSGKVESVKPARELGEVCE